MISQSRQLNQTFSFYKNQKLVETRDLIDSGLNHRI